MTVSFYRRSLTDPAQSTDYGVFGIGVTVGKRDIFRLMAGGRRKANSDGHRLAQVIQLLAAQQMADATTTDIQQGPALS